jgi:hypothetical protein
VLNIEKPVRIPETLVPEKLVPVPMLVGWPTPKFHLFIGLELNGDTAEGSGPVQICPTADHILPVLLGKQEKVSEAEGRLKDPLVSTTTSEPDS